GRFFLRGAIAKVKQQVARHLATVEFLREISAGNRLSGFISQDGKAVKRAFQKFNFQGSWRNVARHRIGCDDAAAQQNESENFRHAQIHFKWSPSTNRIHYRAAIEFRLCPEHSRSSGEDWKGESGSCRMRTR